MWRLIKVLLIAVVLFAVINFFLSNSTPEAQSLATQISFKFELPPLLSLQSTEFTVGYLILIAFILGMVLTALVGGIGTYSKAKELRQSKKRIGELEREIKGLKTSMLQATQMGSKAADNEVPENPEIE